MSYSGYTTRSIRKDAAYHTELREYLVATYQYMGIALGITAIVAMAVSSSAEAMGILFATPLKWLVMIAPIGMAFYMASRITDMSFDAARWCLGIFAALMGLSLSTIFLVFTGESIVKVFFIAASLFGIMCIYGYITKKDLSSIGSFMIMGLIGIMLASIVNVFFASSAVQFVISIVGVLVFTGLTAYDTQRLKESYSQLLNRSNLVGNLAVYGALTLYMDFINLFVMLLHLLGIKREND